MTKNSYYLEDGKSEVATATECWIKNIFRFIFSSGSMSNWRIFTIHLFRRLIINLWQKY